jgi:hypothetical protein
VIGALPFLVLNANREPSPPYTRDRSAVVAMDGVGMDIAKGVISAIVMFAAIAVVIGLLAAMFMIVFSIATGVDEKMQD